MTDRNESVAFVDTETTGLDPLLNPIWEIAVIVDEVEHCWRQQTQLMQIVPEGDTPPHAPYASQWVYDNTRFGEFVHDQTDALKPSESIECFVSLVEGRHIVGAVPSFDEERLRMLYREHIDATSTRYPWHYHLIDVEALAVGWLSAYPSLHERVSLPWDSADLSLAVGVDPADFEPKHTALADARWAKAIYEKVTRPDRPTQPRQRDAYEQAMRIQHGAMNELNALIAHQREESSRV